MTLEEFLLARIAEDEAVAQAAIRADLEEYDNKPGWSGDGHWSVESGYVVTGSDITIYDEGGHTKEQAAHIARYDPARVLAECEAKLRIMDLHRVLALRSITESGLRALATVYVAHPDYPDEWKP